MSSEERRPRRGFMLAVSSPSGAGKTSLCRRLFSDHEHLILSISVTTRGPRPGEEHGREYHKITDGEDILFDIDWQGAGKIAARAPLDTVRVFVMPPSMGELSRRLYARAQDKPEVIERRLRNAKGEIAQWEQYDYIIVNDDFDRSYAEFAHIYHAERSRRQRNLWLSGYVDGLMDEPV